MRILSLNVLDGELKDELKAFLESRLDSIDIFCFQETLGDTIERLFSELFPNTQYSTIAVEKTTDGNGQYNLYTVAKKPLHISHSQTLLNLDDIGTGQALATTITSPDGRTIIVVNVHGAPFPGDKLDNQGRLRQSDTILHWLEGHSSVPIVVCGDFNLLPETESIKMFAAAGYRDLIADYKIPTTRNELAWENWPDNKQLYADYTFVSQQLNVTRFEVPDIEVSDHLPMVISLAL